MCKDKALLWKKLYQFKSHFATTRDGLNMHYLDEGDGVPAVLVHGTPTWSFMYRDLIPKLTVQGRRAIAPDLIGCGLSEKPQNWNYCLENHVKELEFLLDDVLHLEQFDLVLHDWGGAIGMGYATRHPERVRRIVLMNTAAFPSNDCPWAVHLVQLPFIGAFLVRVLNLLIAVAVRKAPARKLSPEVESGYRFPYMNYHDRVATLRFPQDIPFGPRHPSWAFLNGLAEALPVLADKAILLCWGEKDFCFNMNFFRRWQKIYPNAIGRSYPEAAHYLLEDCPEVLDEIAEFLQ